MKSTLVSLGTAFVTVVLFLVALELMRRRGIDPVARISDAVMPPTMSNGGATISPTTASNAAAAGASAS